MPVSALAWIIRVGWAAVPFAIGDVAVTTGEGALLWAAWASVLVATLVPHPISLVVVRVGLPAAVAIAVAARSVPGAGWTAIVAGLALLPEAAMPYVNGPAYPNERRFPLRAPGPLLFGPIQLGWGVVVAVPIGTVRLLATDRIAAGLAVAALGALPVAVAARSLYGLTRRWLVFVPAGLVLHDHLTLADPVLFQKRVVAGLAPADAATDALDLTARALGMALELDLREKVPMTIVTGRRESQEGASARLLFTPTRPGAVLAHWRPAASTPAEPE